MLVTTAQAKRLTCPERDAPCIATQCMGWRWFKEPKGKEVFAESRLGYCGRAGAATKQ